MFENKPDIMTAHTRTTKAPEKRPTLNVTHGDCWKISNVV